MTQPAVPGSANWQRQWTIDAGDVLLQPVTRRIAEDVLAGGPITRTFETGALHNRIPQATPLPAACLNGRDSTSLARFRTQTRCATR